MKLASLLRCRVLGVLGVWAVWLALGLGLGLAAQAQQPELPRVTLNAGIRLISAELARTPQQREIGLMFRRELGSNHGMLFDFGDKQRVCMWMRNTLVPLSVAFLDADGTIINIEDMQPQTLDEHCGKRDVAFALEMPLGWFAQIGFKPGDKLQGAVFQTR